MSKQAVVTPTLGDTPSSNFEVALKHPVLASERCGKQAWQPSQPRNCGRGSPFRRRGGPLPSQAVEVAGFRPSLVHPLPELGGVFDLESVLTYLFFKSKPFFKMLSIREIVSDPL